MRRFMPDLEKDELERRIAVAFMYGFGLATFWASIIIYYLEFVK